MKRQFAKRQVEGVIRLTDGCNTDTGQCAYVVLVTKAESQALQKANLAYMNANHQDPDHKFGFAGDLHPMQEKKSSIWHCVKFLEGFRMSQPFPQNLGPDF